jgi:hypothetical protein
MMLISISAYGQGERLNDEEITDQDIEIRFLGAADPGAGAWHKPVVVSIEYSIEPMGEHTDKVKLGSQRWEIPLQPMPMAVYEKCVFVIFVSDVPSGFRLMEIRVRVRSTASNGVVVIGDWSGVSHVRVIGKPGNPFLTGEL